MFGSLKSCFKKGSAHLAVNLGSWNGDGCLVAEVTFVSENKDKKKEKNSCVISDRFEMLY